MRASSGEYRIETDGVLSCVRIPALSAAGVLHGFGLRGGVAAEQWTHSMGQPLRRPVTATQVHGDHVDVVPNGQTIGAADGLMTDQPGLMVGVYTADCLPILLADPDRRIVAALHVGWRGLIQQIVRKAVDMFTTRWAASSRMLLVALGPCIGRCCFEVGDQVLGPLRRQESALDGIVVPRREAAAGKTAMIDLQAWAVRQLTSLGLSEEQIFAVELCTRCHPALFSSYRRDGRRKQEMFNGIMMPARPA